jgi:biotin carboxylase
MQQAIKEASIKAIRAVGLTQGIAYPQVLATKDGPKVIEIAVRIPGGHMDEVALHCSGIDMVEFSIRLAMGDPAPLASCTRHSTSPALSVLFLTARDFPQTDATIRSIGSLDAAKAAPGVALVRFNLAMGQTIPPLEHSGGRFGAILALGASREEACRRSRDAARLIALDFDTAASSPLTPDL